jgi:hypothetical protein
MLCSELLVYVQQMSFDNPNDLHVDRLCRDVPQTSASINLILIDSNAEMRHKDVHRISSHKSHGNHLKDECATARIKNFCLSSILVSF